MLNDIVAIETADTSDFPYLGHVHNEILPKCIAQAANENVEVAARLEYWRHLNHPYRVRYRQHRDAEEDATKAASEAANPDCRTWWDNFCGREIPTYRRPPGSLFTYPAFEPSVEQLENMKRLSASLLEWRNGSRIGYVLELAELCREQERFEEAESVIQTLDEKQRGVTSKLITRLIKEKQPAPMRYRM